MSAVNDVLARVRALDKKADELSQIGHLMRAAEYYGRAAEAARALGKDNLVAVMMQIRQAHILVIHCIAHMDEGPDPYAPVAASRVDAIALFCSTMNAIERRRAAGTLLEGKCTVAEEAWQVEELQQSAKMLTAARAASLATLAGYFTFLNSAKIATKMLEEANGFAAECSAVQLQSFAQHAVHAAELMQIPRRHGDMALVVERGFATSLCKAVASAGVNGLDPRLTQLLADAWQRLQRSGVLEERNVTGRAPDRNMYGVAFAAVKAAFKCIAAPDRRSCALPSCSVKEAHPQLFKSCAACRAVAYCCKEHQVQDWPSHKAACKATRKANAENQQAGASGA